MKIHDAADAGMDRWNHDRSPIGDERHVTDQRFIENLIDRVFVVHATFGSSGESPVPDFNESLIVGRLLNELVVGAFGNDATGVEKNDTV